MAEAIDMSRLLGFIKNRLTVKILLALTIGVATVMGVIIYLSIANQQQHLHQGMIDYGRKLKYLAYASIKHPMSIGDSDSVEKQLLDIRANMPDAEIVICDLNQRIVFATHRDRINQQLSRFTANGKAVDALRALFATSDPHYEKFFEEELDGKKYLLTMHGIANTDECHHCHGATRKVLGGIISRHSTDATYAAMASLRNRTILISLLGIAAIVSIIHLLLTRLVTRPVTELAAKAKQLARGNLDVAVEPISEDAIGVLGNSFNYMVRSIKDQIEFANALKSAIADPFFMVDTGMTITYMNEACAKLTGYSKAEAEGNLRCRDIFKSDVCDINCPVNLCFETGEPVAGITTTITNRINQRIPIMTSACAFRDANGEVIGAVEICKDISDLLEAEHFRYVKETAEREEEQRKYLETRAGKLLATLSRVSDGDLSVRAEEAGKDEVMDNIARHTNQMLDNLEKLYKKISSFSRELELEVARRTMMLRERTLLLERANRELRELDKLKSSFLANMSHELRTPMNSIIGYTDLILDGVDGPINDEQQKSLLKITNNARHLLQLINDILDMSKIESGKVELDPRETDVATLIASAVSVFEPAIRKKKLSVTYAFADNLPSVYADEEKARQILSNLLSNAIKFTNRGGLTIHARPSPHGYLPGKPPLYVEICVEDTGIGIHKEDIGKLFDKFSQVDISTIRQYEGTGLGLSIARGLVVLHKGIIWAESEYGKGTKLHFTLPTRKEIFDRPAEPIIEPAISERLATYFEKPKAAFLHEPMDGSAPIKCWEYNHCGQTSCPAYGSEEHRCWLIAGTHCKGTMVADYLDKAEFCKGCEIIEKLVLADNNMQTAAMDMVVTQTEQPRKTVLVIDDNPEVIELIKKNIGDTYNVVGLLSGRDAVEQAKAFQPIAITLDIMMPHKDGWQVLQDLKKDPATQNIPVIILSIVDEKKTGFSLGAAEYMVKPIDKQILLRKLHNLEKIASIKQVLIVDHDFESIELMSHMLSEAGYRIGSATTNEAAIRHIKDTPPDLIVFNLTMHDPEAYDLIAFIRTEENMKDIPLILITHADLSDKEIRELNGRIRATLNKTVLSEKALLAELKKTITRLYRS